MIGPPTTTSPPTKEEARLAAEASKLLSRHVSKPLSIHILRRNQASEPVELPASAVELLVRVLDEMAAGNSITLMPAHAELTTQEAADFLHVSRPYLVKVLEEGRIPFRKVGSHRRVRFDDLLRYRIHSDEESRKMLDELVAEAQRLNLGY